MIFRLAAAALLVACAHTSPPPPAETSPAPRHTAAPPSITPDAPDDDLSPAVLRSLLVDGSMRLVIDDAILADLRASGRRMTSATVAICLDVAGVATVELERSSAVPALDRAALALVATWRFHAFERDGVVIPVCSQASFQVFDPDKVPPEFRPPTDLFDGLPPPAVELPANLIVANQLRPGATGVPPTPGIALAVFCRTPGAHEAPRVYLLQSSGDEALDRRLLATRGLRALDEKPGAPSCRLAAAGSPPHAAPPDAPPADAPPADAPPPEPPMPGGPSPTALDALRISGTRNIVPTDHVKRAIAAGGKTEFLVPVKLCLDRAGHVASVKILKSSGHPAYDADLINGVYAWRYRPFLVDGKPAPVCTAILFNYRQRPAPRS